MPASATLSPAETVSVTLDVPADLAARLYAVPSALLNRLLADALDAQQEDVPNDYQTNAALWDDYDPAAEPIDEAFIAELIAADEETKRVGLIPFEEILRQSEADRQGGPGFVERVRARVAARNAEAE